MTDTVVYQGTIQDIATKRTSRDGKYVEVKLLQKGRDQPITLRAFGDTLVDRFDKARKGMEIAFDVEEREGEYQGKPITYRNIIDIRQPSEGVAAEKLFPSEVGELPPMPQGGQQRPQERGQPAQPPVPKPKSNGGWTEAYSQSQECKEIERVSIEAQVAAKIAAELLGTILVTIDGTEAKAGAVDAYFERLTLVAMAAIRSAKKVDNA